MSDVLNAHILQVLDTIWIHSCSGIPEVLPVRIRWVMRHNMCFVCPVVALLLKDSRLSRGGLFEIPHNGDHAHALVSPLQVLDPLGISLADVAATATLSKSNP